MEPWKNLNFTQSATRIMDLKAKIPGISKDAPDRHTTRTLPSEPQRRENNRFGGPIRTPRKYRNGVRVEDMIRT